MKAKENNFTFLLIGLILLCAFFTACSAEDKIESPAEIKADFSSAAKITYREQTYKANLSAGKTGVSLTFTEPEELNGLTYSFQNGKTLITFKGLKFESEKDILTDGNIAKGFFNAVEAIKKSAEDAKPEINDNGDAEFFMNSPSGKFTLTATEFGDIKKISFPDIGLVITFGRTDSAP